MLWLRMFAVALRLAWPDLLTPWRSPLLRWRMETYGLVDAHGHRLHADALTASHFFAFVTAHHQALARFLRWAATL